MSRSINLHALSPTDSSHEANTPVTDDQAVTGFLHSSPTPVLEMTESTPSPRAAAGMLTSYHD